MKNLSACMFVLGLAVIGCDNKPATPAKPPVTTGAAALGHAPAAADKKGDATATEKKDDAPAADKKDDAPAAAADKKDDAPATEKKDE